MRKTIFFLHFIAKNCPTYYFYYKTFIYKIKYFILLYYFPAIFSTKLQFENKISREDYYFYSLAHYSETSNHKLMGAKFVMYTTVYNILPKTKKFGCVGRGDMTLLFFSKVVK